MRALTLLLLVGSAAAQPNDPVIGPEVPAGESLPPAEPMGTRAAQGIRRAAGRPTSLAEDPEAPLALAAYNGARYDEAAQRFMTLVQRWPREPAPYRALARARVWAGDAAGAVVAYRNYLQLNPDAGDRDKIEAELKQAGRKAGPHPPDGPPVEAVRALAEAVPRAQAGKLSGPDGAFAALDAAEDLGYIGPGLADARDQVSQALFGRGDDAIERWWRPEAQAAPADLRILLASFDDLKKRRPLTPAEASLPGALEGLLALAEGRGDEAVRQLSGVAPGDPRLRYAQAVALLEAGRAEEAESLLSLLAQSEADPRVALLLGLTRRLLGRDDAVEALKQALQE